MKTLRLLKVFQIAFIFLCITSSGFAQDVTNPSNSPCLSTGINPVDNATNTFKSGFGSRIYAARFLPSIAKSDDDFHKVGGKIDDRTCTYNYTQEKYRADNVEQNYGVYRIKADTNPFDTNGLQPRIERESRKITTNLRNPGTRVELKGVVVIRRVGSGSNPGTYICQAKGKFNGQPDPNKDPALALLLVKETSNNRLKFFLEATNSTVRQEGGGQRQEFDLKFEVAKNTRVEVIFKNEIIDNNAGGITHRVQVKLRELRNSSNSIEFNYKVPEPTRAKDIKIRFGAYRCWGGEAAIYWRSDLSIINTLSTKTPKPVSGSGSNWSDLSNGWYTITPQSNANMRLALNNADLIQKWGSNSDDSQKFYVEKTNDGGYFIRTYNNKYLDVYGNNTTNGAYIGTWNFLNSNNQKWKFSDGNNGYIYVASKLNLNKGLHIYNYNANTNNAGVNLWDIYNGNNHRFKFTPTSAPGSNNGGNTACTNPTASVASKGTNNINVRWNNVNANSYYIYLQRQGGSWQLINDNVSGTSFNITGLSPNTRYYIDVWARCSNGSRVANRLNVLTNNSGSSGGNTTSGSNLLTGRPSLSDFNSGFFNNNANSFGAQNAVDGNGSTRWASSANGNNPDFIGWDLGRNYNISQMKVKWEAARGIDFGFVYYNNGWFYMNNITNNNSLQNTANVNVNARYVGIYISRGSNSHSSAYEIEAYGNQAKSASNKNNITATAVPGNFPEIAIEDKDIKIYPNPVNTETFTINLKGMESAHITITNVLGKVVYKTTTDQSSIKINKSGLFKTGVYIVVAKDSDSNVFTSKLLIK